MQTDFPVPEESQNISKSQNKQTDAMKKKINSNHLFPGLSLRNSKNVC